MAASLLPDAAVRTLGRWWSENASACADGTPGTHTVRYTPGRWAQITPWPSTLTPTSCGGDAGVSRAEVASAVADALRREAFRGALVATYVWGKGKRGTPGGSGPATLHKILAAEGLDAALARAVTTLSEHSAKSCLRWAPEPRSRVRSVVLQQVPVLRRQDGFVGNRPPAARPRPGSGPASAVPGRGGRPGNRPRPRRLDRQVGLAGQELVSAPLRGLPLLHAGGGQPSSGIGYLAARRLARPARIRPIQRLVDVNPSPRRAPLPQVAGGAGPCSRTGGTRSPAGCRRCATRRWRRAARQ